MQRINYLENMNWSVIWINFRMCNLGRWPKIAEFITCAQTWPT